MLFRSAACVVLGIAVDDSIHYITRFNVRAKERADVRRGTIDALADVGPSITAAALSEFLAFAVGATTDIPALEQFCIVAAVAASRGQWYRYPMTLRLIS